MEIEEFLKKFENYHDYLAPASQCGEESRQAIENKEYDLAWSKIMDAKQLYILHAKQNEFTYKQTVALVGGLDRGLANICKLEGRHKQALIHIIYCSACKELCDEAQLLTVRPYFNRCKFKNSILQAALDLASNQVGSPDFRYIQDVVSKWS